MMYILLPLAGGGWMGVSCSDWDDHYEANTSQGSNLTLWQQMQQEPQLNDFCQVLEQTKVFRMHRKTSVSYADLLASGGQSFTVVAPKNGTFNRDSLLRLVQTNQGDSVVEKFFVLNHISRSATSLSGIKADATEMLLLNGKHVSIAANDIQGVSISGPNKHASNGVLHIAEHPLPYDYNLYEALCDMPDMAGIGGYLRQYEEDWFDAESSVSSGIVEGVPVYVDSVVIERNRMLERIGLIAAEDSSYWVVAPTTAGWNRAWEQTEKYFVYDKSVLKRDSIQQFWTTRALLDDAIFNLTDQKSTQDYLLSVPYYSWLKSWTTNKPIFHVFLRPFAPGGILYGAQAVNCSNGILYKVDEWPFTPEQTFFKELWSEGESTWLITAEKDCRYNTRRQVADSISENGYLQIIPDNNRSNWELTFRVNNTLAGDYDICAILLPKSITGQTNLKAEDSLACKFRVTINYADEEGRILSDNRDNIQFKNNPLKVDTIVLAEAFHFPTCNYDQQDIKTTVKLSCYIMNRENRDYSREMYLDCLYLRPHRKNIDN